MKLIFWWHHLKKQLLIKVTAFLHTYTRIKTNPSSPLPTKRYLLKRIQNIKEYTFTSLLRLRKTKNRLRKLMKLEEEMDY